MAINKVNDSHSYFFQLLSNCPQDKLIQLLHHLCDVFCGQRQSFIEYSEVYSLLEWWDLINRSQEFFKTACNKSPEFKTTGPEQQGILDVINLRSSDLNECLLEKSHGISSSYLQSFDWKLKFVLTSDKLSEVNESRLSLDMNLTGNNVIHLDLSKQELKFFIDTMEKAKKMQEKLSHASS